MNDVIVSGDSFAHEFFEANKIPYILDGESKEISTEYALENEEIWDISKNADNSIIARWTLNDKTLTISGNGTMKDWEDNTEDDWHKKYENAIKKVIVEGNIINLGDYAFENCNSLENVVLTEEYFLVVRN